MNNKSDLSGYSPVNSLRSNFTQKQLQELLSHSVLQPQALTNTSESAALIKTGTFSLQVSRVGADKQLTTRNLGRGEGEGGGEFQ